MAYSKTNWSPTVAITPSNLNKIEQGIFDNDANIGKLESDISDAWNSSVTYGVNSYCIYNNKLWKCKVQHTNQPPTEGTYWTACTISGEISELNSNLEKIKLNDKTESANSSDILIINNYCFVENNVVHINISIRALNNVATWSKMFRFNGYNLYGKYITVYDYNNNQNLFGYWENGWFNIAEGLTQGHAYIITGTLSID